MLEVSPRTVLSYVRSGLLAPRREAGGAYRFDFQDLVVLRAARALTAERVPARRVRRALARLRRQLPAGRSLSAVRIAAEGGEVVVRAGGEAWEPASGQRVLDFEAAPAATAAAPAAVDLPAPAVHPAARSAGPAAGDPAPDPAAAERWFEVGCELEASDPAGARDAYRRALALDPGHAGAHLDLGRLLHEAGDPAAAAEHYRAAMALAPGDATAAFNLGVALQDLGRPGEAIGAYSSAVEADPACADAYFNLAQLYDELGQRAAAIRSLKAYKALTGE